METLRRVLIVVSPVALGFFCWALVGPSDRRTKELSKELPESNPVRLAERQRQNALVMAALEEAARTNENVAHRPVPWKKE